jgi:hypothetical protein
LHERLPIRRPGQTRDDAAEEAKDSKSLREIKTGKSEEGDKRSY